MAYYDVKPHSLVAFEYCSGSDFNIEIFNCYIVEIDYGLKDIPLEYGLVNSNHMGCVVRNNLSVSDCEIDKLC